jgi:hypothetical protein
LVAAWFFASQDSHADASLNARVGISAAAPLGFFAFFWVIPVASMSLG